MAMKTEKEQFITELQARGFQFSSKNEYYKVKSSGKYNNLIGVKVGEYVHSCHVDTTDLIVLMFLDLGNEFFDSFIDLWIEKL